MAAAPPDQARTALRVGFAGTPDFAATALAALLDAGFTIPLVLTRPDRPKGRGLSIALSPVKALALARGLMVEQPATLKNSEARAPLMAIPLDVLVVAAYGLILPEDVLGWPRFGCLNIHASLLPRWRGAAPIARAVEAGDTTSGVTIMQMDAGLDTGAIVESFPVPLAPEESAETLHDKLAAVGASAIVTTLARLQETGHLACTPQPVAGVTYAHKLERREAFIDWTLPAREIDRRVRAFDPAPVAWTTLAGVPLKIWRASARDEMPRRQAPPGEVLDAGSQGIDVACGSGMLRITALQAAGSRRLDAQAFAAGRAPLPGTVLGR
jgi:methionyl-tRNA formyltransferase